MTYAEVKWIQNRFQAEKFEVSVLCSDEVNNTLVSK
jgi:hypothetical protein